MDLTAAINLVIAELREEDPDRVITDHGIVDEIREFGHDEIDSWVEVDVVEAGSELEEAYRAVIDATDDEIANRL